MTNQKQGVRARTLMLRLVRRVNLVLPHSRPNYKPWREEEGAAHPLSRLRC